MKVKWDMSCTGTEMKAMKIDPAFPCTDLRVLSGYDDGYVQNETVFRFDESVRDSSNSWNSMLRR